MKEIFLICLILLSMPFARADEVAMPDDMNKQMQIASLKREISELEIELSECMRKNKNWKTATWIGAAGTVATGAGAIIQGVKLNKLKNEKSNEKKSDEK